MVNCVHLYGQFEYGKGYDVILLKWYDSFFGAWYDTLACTTMDKNRQKSYIVGLIPLEVRCTFFGAYG
jgi:hypothetical protein